MTASEDSKTASPTRHRRLGLLGTATLLSLLSIVAFFSCSPGFVARAAWEEARILWKRQPIEDVLNDPFLDLETRTKLELVVQARSFARRDLNLDVGKSYTSFSHVNRDTLALVLSASPVDRLAAYTWWFPIVGRVPYKGFFDLEAAEAERRRLENKGYDTYLRPTAAFSTLGWLPDPMLSTALDQDSVDLVETVIHEVTHNTLWVRGHVKFNESLANFVGSVGAVEFFCGRGYDDSLCRSARNRWHDRQLLGEFLDELWEGLENLYSENLEPDELSERRRSFKEEANTFFQREYAPAMLLPIFSQFDPTTLNNASLIARHLYYHRLHAFQALYDDSGSLTTALLRLSAAVDKVDDPWQALGELAGYVDLGTEGQARSVISP